MNSLLSLAIESCTNSPIAFSKFITANDTGATGGHQAGFHIHKHSSSLFFETPGVKGSNKDVFIKIKWQGDFETDSRFIYYGVGTRNEYRLTRFGRGFPFLNEDNTGDLLVIAKKDDNYYEAYVLSDDLDIEGFFNAFGISPTETNGILPKSNILTSEQRLVELFKIFIERLTVEFPRTIELANGARELFLDAYGLTLESVLKRPDKELLNWIATEFNLFKAIENDRYSNIINEPIKTVDELVKIANTILNRRKSRAGKSLEHHLSQIFDVWNLMYTSQATTESNKKPDFIFPSIEKYFEEPLGSDNLIFLGAKTTCKDRWRQIVSEADRIPNKHLFTLQQGISVNQLNEMKDLGVTLVVPQPYLTCFPREYRDEIWSLYKFVNFVSETQK